MLYTRVPLVGVRQRHRTNTKHKYDTLAHVGKRSHNGAINFAFDIHEWIRFERIGLMLLSIRNYARRSMSISSLHLGVGHYVFSELLGPDYNMR